MNKRAESVKTYLVTGFLGAGKTTFILEQLKRVDANIAVLVNEFGALGIDGEIIRIKGGVDVVEMPGGCICCSRKTDFAAGVKAIVENKKPDLLLIEPSGVAEISTLLKELSDESLNEIIEFDATITVVDATTFEQFFEGFGDFFKNQIKCADFVIINKRDLVDRERLEAIEHRVGALNSRAQVISTEHCQVNLRLLADRGLSGQNHDHDHDHSRDNGLGLETLSFEPARPLSRQELDGFLSELSTGYLGNIVRVKGFIEMSEGGFVGFQATPTAISVEPFDRLPSPRVVVIGRGLKAEIIGDLLGVSRLKAATGSFKNERS